MTPAIQVKNLSKKYRLGQLHRKTQLREAVTGLLKAPFSRKNSKETIYALRDVTFTIGQGEVVGIIGRNGAGKSTLLKVLSKITHPTSGELAVRGRISSLLEVGTGFHEELTGRENIFLNGSILGMSKKEILGRLEEIIAFAGVERFIDTPIKRYSSGMRLRLGFAVAAHLDPDILLIDEVLAVGDAEFQKKCLNAMKDLNNVGRTVLFVSHNMAAVENLCPRAIWIDGGEIRADGESKEIIKQYLSTFAGVNESATKLREIKTRRGAGEVRFEAIEFLSTDKQPQKLICSGDDLRIRLHYEVHQKVTNPHFGVEIYSDLGTMITSVNSWATGYEIAELTPGKGHIEVEINFLNLMPGRYYVSLWAASKGLLYDHLDQCALFDVEASNFYRSGRGIESRFGLIFLPCKWEHDGTPGNGNVRPLRKAAPKA